MNETSNTTEIEATDNITSNRYTFFGFISSRNGNPNGDPDNGNAPRIDTYDNHGIITDVSIKGHARRAVKQIFGTDIMIDKSNECIKSVINKFGKTEDESSDDTSSKKNKKKGNVNKENNGKELCKAFWDIRTFGGVFGNDSSSITGPVQISNAKSIHPISINEMAINRCIPNELKEDNAGNLEVHSQFGDKPYQSYGLYQFTGEINPFQAKNTGFNDEDRKKLFEGLNQAYTLWCSAQKGETEMAKIIVFKHESALGNAKLSKLRECISIKLRDGVTVPTDYSDYEITVDESKLPKGISVEVIE